MSFQRKLQSWINGIFRRVRLESDLSDELRFHLESRSEDLMQERGLSRDKAMRQARLDFGSVEKCKDQARQARGLQAFDEFRADLKFALRTLSKNPAFAMTAILSLALGIGANTVVFGVVDGLLLRPLPIESPEQLYSVDRNDEPSNSFLDYRDIRDRNTVFSSLFMYRIAHMSLEDREVADRVWGLLVTGNYFETLGIQPALGRFFGPDEDLYPNASPYGVLSYDAWQNRFGGDPGIIGRTIRINTHTYTVLAVAPEGFHGTDVFYWPEIWLPLTMQAQIEEFSWLDRRRNLNGWVAGRLKPGVTPQQADENLKVIAEGLAREYTSNEGMRLTVSAPGLAGSTLRRPVSAFAAGVMILAALVLLAACVNIASLLSARLKDRTRELSIRLSIGSGDIHRA